MLEEGYAEQHVRKSHEQENRERDERHEQRLAKAAEEEREKVDQERAQSQVPRPEFQMPQFQRPEHGSFRSFDQNRANFVDRRQPPTGMSEDQFNDAFRQFLAQQQFGGNQDHGPRENYRRDDGQFRGQGVAQVCHNWLNKGDCSFGNNCKFAHSGNDGDNYPKRAKRN